MIQQAEKNSKHTDTPIQKLPKKSFNIRSHASHVCVVLKIVLPQLKWSQHFAQKHMKLQIYTPYILVIQNQCDPVCCCYNSFFLLLLLLLM